MAPSCLLVGIDRRLAPCSAEVGYALGTLLETAGYAQRAVWLDAPGEEPLDLYYGPEPERARARVAIPWCGRDLREVTRAEVRSHVRDGDAPCVSFDGAPAAPPLRAGDALRFANDLVFASHWFLTGAREPDCARDRWDNLSLAGSSLLAHGLVGVPFVSLWAARLREHFEGAGLAALPAPWGRSALALTHDVDYPEILRAVEWLRAPARGAAGLRALRHMTRADAFWRFAEWADFAETLGTRSCFYFMARRGSLVRYALGDPDAFYDAGSPRFRALFGELRARGCEIGLHASYRSSEEPERFAAEKARIEELSRGPVRGNRNHYWRLDPQAPHETLAHLERAGFAYDSSLAFELYPGFRRGLCHPFRPWHPGERRALELVELPPAWMDDQYDGRLAESGIADPEAHARGLLAAVHRTGGVAVLDYHVRGLSPAFPRWGAWLESWLRGAMPPGMQGAAPGEIAERWRAWREVLARAGAPLGAAA